MDKVVDEFVNFMKSMDLNELKMTTKVLDERLDNILTYKKDIEVLENKVLEKDKERFKSLRKYETNIRELYDVESKIKSLKEEIRRLEIKKEKLKKESLKSKQMSDKSSREFLDVKKELKERRKQGINGSNTIKINKTHKRITLNDLENNKIVINGATSIGKINNTLIENKKNTGKTK